MASEALGKAMREAKQDLANSLADRRPDHASHAWWRGRLELRLERLLDALAHIEADTLRTAESEPSADDVAAATREASELAKRFWARYRPYREAPRKGMPHAVKFIDEREASTALRASGRCDWQTAMGTGPLSEACGAPVQPGETLCHEHRAMLRETEI